MCIGTSEVLMNDFEYVNQFFLRASEKEEKCGMQALSPTEMTIFAVWHATGLIVNGGLQNFFIWEGASPKIADSFEEIGMPDVAIIIRQFFSILPAVNFNNFTSAKRDIFIEKNFDYVKNKIEELNNKFYQLEPNIAPKAAVFVKRGKSGPDC
jgi:hypothetical protein